MTEKIIGCAIEVHHYLGPGLLESAYEQSMAHELSTNGVDFKRQVLVQVQYKGMLLDCGYRVDLLIDDQVIVELKSVDQITRLHQAQLLTYMKLASVSTGLLVNFNVRRVTDGIKRFKL